MEIELDKPKAITVGVATELFTQGSDIRSTIEALFPNFFFEAQARFLPHGRLLLLFSNLAQITLVCKDHPIAKELEEGGRFVLEHCFKKQVKAASNKSKRNQNWRAQEEVELWVLKHRL